MSKTLTLPLSTLRDKELTPRALQILMFGVTEPIWKLADLAEAAEIDVGTVYVNVRRLEKAGYAHKGAFYGSWSFSIEPGTRA